MHVWVYARVGDYAYVHMQVETTVTLGVSPPQSSICIFWDEVPCWARSSLIQLGWLASGSGIPPPLPQFQPGTLLRFFHLSAGNPTQVLMLDWNYYSQSYYNVNTGESTSCSNDSVSVRRAWTMPTSVNQLKEHIDSYVWHHGMRYSDSPKHNTLHQTQCSILCWKLAEGKMCPLSPLWRLFRIKRALFSWPLKPTLQRNKNYTISAHGTNMKDDLNWSPEDLFLVGLGNELPLYLRLWASFSTSRTELIGASDIPDKKRTVDRWAVSA